MPEAKTPKSGPKSKLGPLPVWGWAALILGGIAVWYFFLRKPSTAASGQATPQAGTDLTGTGLTGGGSSTGAQSPIDQGAALQTVTDAFLAAQTQFEQFAESTTAGALALADTNANSLTTLATDIINAGLTGPSVGSNPASGGSGVQGTTPANTHKAVVTHKAAAHKHPATKPRHSTPAPKPITVTTHPKPKPPAHVAVAAPVPPKPKPPSHPVSHPKPPAHRGGLGD